MMPSSPPYSNEEILAELDALSASKAFRRSPGLNALLRFVVEAELRSEGSDLKETILGTAVYHREANYDTKADGIVRVNANRLRARLKDHYRQFPARVQIVLEPGSYRPIFLVKPRELEPVEIAADDSALPISSHRLLWVAGVVAVLFVLASGSLVWFISQTQEHWTQRWVSRMSGIQQFPDFSPDSRRLAYAVEDPANGTSALYVQNLQSDIPIKLTTGERYESRPVWSPDGSRLAFIVRDHDQTVHVFVRPLKEDHETEIYSHQVSGPMLCDIPRLSWSAVGDEIVTTAPPTPAEMAANPNQSPACGIVAVNVVTHAVRRITRSPIGTEGDLEPTVSPDGRTIAFLRPISYEAQDIYLVNMDGTHENRLRTIRDDIQGIAWMPGGKGLLLCARKGNILQLNLQSGQTVSIQSGAAPIGFGTISPDGRHIAYTEYHQQNKLLHLKDGRLEDVFDDGLLRQYPAYSPDGMHIAYSSDRTGQNQLWISDRDGHGEFLVTANAKVGMTRPVWSADGKSLLFECRENGPSAICAVNLNSHQVVPLVRMKDDAILPFLSRDGKRIYFTSNDTGSYAGYRQMIHTAADGNLIAEGKPEPMTIGGTGIIYESPSGQELYLIGPLPSLSLLGVPLSKVPIQVLPGDRMNPSYVLREQSMADGSSTIADSGLLSVEEGAGGYRIALYPENKKEPKEFLNALIDEPIDSIAWDPMDKAVLLATHSTPIGALLSLSK